MVMFFLLWRFCHVGLATPQLFIPVGTQIWHCATLISSSKLTLLSRKRGENFSDVNSWTLGVLENIWSADQIKSKKKPNHPLLIKLHALCFEQTYLNYEDCVNFWNRKWWICLIFPFMIFLQWAENTFAKFIWIYVLNSIDGLMDQFIHLYSVNFLQSENDIATISHSGSYKEAFNASVNKISSIRNV